MVWQMVRRLMAGIWKRLHPRAEPDRQKILRGVIFEECPQSEVTQAAALFLQSRMRRMLVASRQREMVEALVLGHYDTNCILSALNSDLLHVIIRQSVWPLAETKSHTDRQQKMTCALLISMEEDDIAYFQFHVQTLN